MSKDYYKILGIEKHATSDEIKKSFKKLAMQHHPDRQGGDEAKFKEVNEAYQVLSDTEKRQKYDQFGSDFEQQGGFPGGHPGGGFQFDFGGADFGDAFGEMFGFGGGRGGRARENRGRDIQVDMELDFIEAAFGIEKEVTLRKQSTCDVCSGSGGEPGSKIDTCTTCNGSGQVMQNQRTFLGMMQTMAQCTTCHGRGKFPSQKCKHCGGDGVAVKQTTAKVKIPAGIDEGQSIRITGYGEAAPHGGTPGDLYVQVHIKPSKVFHRDGFDVYTENAISFPQAVLGDTIQIDTIDGELKIAVPEGTESGQLIRLKGKGIQHINSKSRGDHYVKVTIRVPRKLDKHTRKALEDLKEKL